MLAVAWNHAENGGVAHKAAKDNPVFPRRCVRHINVVPIDWICRVVFCAANVEFESSIFAVTVCIGCIS